MAFGMDRAKAGNTANKAKAKPGMHLCKVLDIRHHKGRIGEGFYFDLEVVDGPSGAGFRFSPSCYPEVNAARSASTKLTYDECLDREWGKIQRWAAACAGLDTDRQAEIDNARFAGIIARPKTPLAGRLVRVKAVEHEGQRGATVYYEFTPVADQGEASLPAAPAPAAAPFAPPPPAAPAARPLFEQAMAAAGWYLHPNAPGHVYNAAGAVVTVAELKTQLGY